MSSNSKNKATLEKLSLLVQLSKADNYVDEKEKARIHQIGENLGYTKEEVENIIDYPIRNYKLNSLTEDEKFEYLFDIIQLMKIDGKVFQSEIKFCEKLAIKLGFLPGVISDLSAYIYSDPQITTEWDFLKKIAKQHLIKNK